MSINGRAEPFRSSIALLIDVPDEDGVEGVPPVPEALPPPLVALPVVPFPTPGKSAAVLLSITI